jgi:hypothetical protein
MEMFLTRKAIMFSAALAILSTGALGAAGFGRLPQQTTYLSFSVPVALPGVTLGSGTYIFERADPNLPDVVRVLSRDRSRIYYTGFTLPVTRPEAGALVSLQEAPASKPQPISAWWPEGGTRGHRFYYPHHTDTGF